VFKEDEDGDDICEQPGSLKLYVPLTISIWVFSYVGAEEKRFVLRS
jgi:hypothetical protein